MLAIPLALLGVVVTPPCLSRFHAGAPSTQRHCTPHLGIGDFFQKLGEELDNFADDATMRRMGNGAKFYGKRKSSFYGEEDSERKKDPQVANPDEDWRGACYHPHHTAALSAALYPVSTSLSLHPSALARASHSAAAHRTQPERIALSRGASHSAAAHRIQPQRIALSRSLARHGTGPAGGSFFVISKERDEEGRPLKFLTRKEAREEERRGGEEKWEAAKRAQEMSTAFERAMRGESGEEMKL